MTTVRQSVVAIWHAVRTVGYTALIGPSSTFDYRTFVGSVNGVTFRVSLNPAQCWRRVCSVHHNNPRTLIRNHVSVLIVDLATYLRTIGADQ